MVADSGIDNNLDEVFAEIGEFGTFQIVSILLICVPSLLSASYIVNFIFAANTLDYRCKISECDVGIGIRETGYDQNFLEYAIPKSKNGFANCHRFAPNNSILQNELNGEHGTVRDETEQKEKFCNRDMFDRTEKIQCTEFVYKTDETNVQTEFNIHCEDDYKLALIGSANNIGRLLFLPLTGILSDKFGRLRITVWAMLICSMFGLIKSFSFSYEMYILCEFLEASAGTCIFSGIYVLGIEWISSNYRALGGTLIIASFPLGEMILGIVAMYIHNFRYLLRVLYSPGLFIIFYFWLVPESPRWYLITGRIECAIKVLKRIASVNGRHLSEKSIGMLRSQYTQGIRTTARNKLTIFEQLRLVFGSRILSWRFLNCCYQWITCCFCYYGLSLIITHIPAQNRYVSYIIVQAVEIPGALLPVLLLNRLGRRKLMCMSLVLAGISSIITPWIPDDQSLIVLLLFMVGKAATSFAFNILYIFTAELWPTNLRTTIMNLCSMTGRLGATFAPLTTLLIVKIPYLPFILFGSTALVAAVLVLFCPESFGKKLPDTVEDAKHL